MSCKTKCSRKKRPKCPVNKWNHQPIPRTGPLAHNNRRYLSLDELRESIADWNDVYFYVMTSVEYCDQKFLQKGTGPNFQGGLITLCTCMHRMRSALSARDWRGKWIAGLTSITEHQRKNFLVYLMKVSKAFESHYDLWVNESISPETKLAKAAHLNEFGDIYKPKRRIIGYDKTEDYEKPCEGHSHIDDWGKDIKYEKGYHGRAAALLVGSEEKSFLWDVPKIWYSHQLPRSFQRLELNEFFKQLKSD